MYIYIYYTQKNIDAACNGQFTGEYVIPQLQILVLFVADCTEGSCSSNISCNFLQVLYF